METNLSNPLIRQDSAERSRQSDQAAAIDERPSTNWGLRIAFVLGLVLTTGWGFLLGVGLVRLNTLFLFIGMALTALPAAFLGCVIVSVAFHTLMNAWRRFARLLFLLVTVAAGVLLGIAWATAEQSLDPVQFVNTTGTLIWQLEGGAALAGLIGGTWPGWLRPFSDRVGLLFHTILAGPFRVIRFIVRIPWLVLQAIARFFEDVGRGFLWIPLGMAHFFGGIYQGVHDRLTGWRTPAPAAEPPSPTRRRRSRAAKRSKHSRTRHPEGPRVIGVVEDRCPYCFDVVKRNDSRGVHVCEVCGTPHHADCWAITGKCQVPHLNT